MKNVVYILLSFLIFPVTITAQQLDLDRRQIYIQAENEYQIGHIDNAIDILESTMSSYDKTIKVSACRLLALCYLANDEITKADRYVDILLAEDPYYSISLQDPIRFSELIEKKREGKVKLVTASQQAETLDEAPVPVTLITEDMIKAIGGRTLKDVLIAYVPGITSIESPNESNIAMHGVYSSGQEKILIMINGQRMNARITNKAAPDFSINLDKVKRIEILRGPASSLYGNVALMAVVNLITKDGGDIAGMEVAAGLGNFGQKKASILMGKRFMGIDFMGWASFYASNGQSRFIPKEQSIGNFPHNGHAIVEGYNHLPSYDVGFTFKWDKLSLIINQRYGKKVPSFADVAGAGGALYTYDKYKKFKQEAPGHGMSFTHAGVSYADKIRNVSFDINMYFDLNKSNQYSVIGDSVSQNPVGSEEEFKSAFQIMDWSEYALGGVIMGNYAYPHILGIGKGNILIGSQIEYMKLYGSEGLIGKDFTNVVTYWPTNPIQLGGEITYSPFLQLKHYFRNNVILNAGFRYDNKVRVNKNNVASLSPRISLIYILNSKLNMKLNYARSFVDAPYFYRYNQSPSYKGSGNLQPEYMTALQFDFNYQYLPSFFYNSVLFYNDLSGFIYKNQNATGEEPRYINAGQLKSIGIENTLQYNKPRFFSNLNFTYQSVLKGKNYSFTKNRIHNIPNWFVNLSVNGNVMKKKEHEFWIYWSGRCIGKQLSPINNVLVGGVKVTNPDNTLPAVFTANAGVRYIYRNIEMDLNCYNLFNKTYYEGGSVKVPYIQQGFSMLATLKYKISK